MGFKVFYEQKYSTRNEKLNPMKLKALSYLPSPPRKILDVGCGSGLLTQLLMGRGYDTIGIDISEKAIEKCREKGLLSYQQDLSEELLFEDEVFDCVLMSEVIEHLVDPYFALREIHRVLKKKGILVITTPNSSFITRRLRYLLGKTSTETQNFSHLRFFNVRLLNKILHEVNYDILDLKGYIFNPLNLNTGFTLDFLKNLLSENFIVIAQKNIEEKPYKYPLTNV